MTAAPASNGHAQRTKLTLVKVRARQRQDEFDYDHSTVGEIEILGPAEVERPEPRPAKPKLALLSSNDTPSLAELQDWQAADPESIHIDDIGRIEALLDGARIDESDSRPIDAERRKKLAVARQIKQAWNTKNGRRLDDAERAECEDAEYDPQRYCEDAPDQVDEATETETEQPTTIDDDDCVVPPEDPQVARPVEETIDDVVIDSDRPAVNSEPFELDSVAPGEPQQLSDDPSPKERRLLDDDLPVPAAPKPKPADFLQRHLDNQPQFWGEDEVPGLPKRAAEMFRAQMEKLEEQDLYGQEEHLPFTPGSQAHTAQEIVNDHGEEIRWVQDQGVWLNWDTSHWREDKTREIWVRAKHTARRLLIMWAGGDDVDDIRYALALGHRRYLGDALDLAKSERWFDEPITITTQQLDTHHHLLNCANGVLDLRTGGLLPHDRSLLLTKLCPVEYDPNAKCPLWEATVLKIMSGDTEMVGALQRVLGSTLSGEVRGEHTLPIFWGAGSNGKNLILDTVQSVLADYAYQASSTLLMEGSEKCELAELHGRRLVVTSETKAGARLEEATVKKLTGDKTINGRRLYQAPFTFERTHSIIMATNDKPRIVGTNHAIWRRLLLCPFLVLFWERRKGETGPPELEADGELPKKLQTERQGILRWLVDGCRAWYAIGLRPPRKVLAATAKYRSAEDTLGQFVTERTKLGQGLVASKKLLTGGYGQWCKLRNEHPVSARRLTTYLEEMHGVVLDRGRRHYLGIEIRDYHDHGVPAE